MTSPSQLSPFPPVKLRAVQHSFDLGLATGRPMHSISGTMAILDRDEDDVLNLIELTLLRFAFDIRSPKSEKKEVRILADSIRAYLRGDHQEPKYFSGEQSLEAALAVLFKHSRPTVRGTEVRRAFNCSSQHVLDLINEGCLTLDTRVELLTPKTSPTIFRSSILNFLKSRRLP